jgi:hypothetical protein
MANQAGEKHININLAREHSGKRWRDKMVLGPTSRSVAYGLVLVNRKRRREEGKCGKHKGEGAMRKKMKKK